MHVNFNLSVIIILYIFFFFSECSSKNYLSYAYDQVPFSKWWVPEQTREHHLVLLGLMLVSLCVLLLLFALHWLWHRATLRSNWGIKPLTPCSARKVALHRDFPCFGGPHLNLKNYLHVILIQLYPQTPLRTYMQQTYMQDTTCPCLTNLC